MILIGKEKHCVVCINCESLYLYDKSDVIEKDIPGLTEDFGLRYRYVKCPSCGYEHIV